MQTMKGTPIFMAPEMFDNKYSFPADVFAVGLILLMIENPAFNYESKTLNVMHHCF